MLGVVCVVGGSVGIIVTLTQIRVSSEGFVLYQHDHYS